MTDKTKAEELNDKALDQVAGGGLTDSVKQWVRTPPKGTTPVNGDPLQTEVVNEVK
jgi:bacteriocin-like protein